jgi:tetratricopeptide (TPR) repeat protein
LFLTQEKALRRIVQDRERGDMNRARERAVEALAKWPDDYNLAIEAAQACIALSDYPQAANILKNAYKRHGDRRSDIMELARSAFGSSYNMLIGGFIIEALLRSRNLEDIANLLSGCPESFLGELVKRGETKAKNLSAAGQGDSALAGENELLLGLLYFEGKQFDRANASLGRALEILPDDAQSIGAVLVRVEQELPDSAQAKFYLGLASALLAHPDKAEIRFFQCLELEQPPLEKILSTIDAMREPSPNALLLRGEVLMRLGNAPDGIAAVRGYLAGQAAPGAAPEGERADAAQSPEPMRLAEARLSILPPDVFAHADITFLYCDVALGCNLMKRIVEVLDASMASVAENVPRVVAWLEHHEDTVASTAPGRYLLARAYLAGGNIEQGIASARLASDMDPSILPSLLESVRARVEGNPESEPKLKALLSELYARAGDRESAEEILGGLKRQQALPEAELMGLSGEIMQRCGVLLTGVVSILEMGIERGSASEALPYLIAFCREKPEEHELLARDIEEIAEKHENGWRAVAELADALAKEETLSAPLRFLQATAHLYNGEVERAIFEFDQLIMINAGMRSRLVDIYEKAATHFDTNPTLHLALYHVCLEEELLADAARHLCRTLEIDPKQIRDVVSRFEKLVEREPENLHIWEELLKTSLAINHTNLAREILSRAIATLPPEKAAALHVYGARTSAADGQWEEALRCISLSLTSPHANLRALEEEIRRVIDRDPTNHQAHLLLGEALLRIGDESGGVAAFKRCLELSPSASTSVKEKLEKLLPLSSEPWLILSILGEIAWAEGQRDEAFHRFAAAQKGPREALADLSRSLERICASAPDDLRLALLYARNLALENRHRDAVVVLERLISEDPTVTRTVTDILLGILADEPMQLEANRLLARIFICLGDTAKALEPLVRLMSDEQTNPGKLGAVAAEFLALYEKNASFLIAYATLKARMEEPEEALARYRAAFDLDPGSGEAILRALRSRAWPDELSDTERILRADCLIAADTMEEAFTVLDTCLTNDGHTVDEIVRRLSRLIERKADKRYFSLGAALLASAGQIETAEKLVAKGCRVLDGEATLDLQIEFGETLYRAGEAARGERVFADVLAATANKQNVLRRIEWAAAQWIDRECAALGARLDSGTISESETARLVALTLDRNRPADALTLIARSGLRGWARSMLLGRAYLALDRPALALAALGSCAKSDFPDEEWLHESLYLEGLASESIGDYGRAAAAFSSIAASDGAYRDCRARALRNYTRFLEVRCADAATVLEKAISIERS